MAIEVIVNGFYRSGTTMLWDILKQSNPEKNIFYEPLNPYLAYYIRKEEYYNTPNALHNLYLFQEYIRSDKNLIDKIIDKHPVLDHPLPNDKQRLYEYLNIFDELDNSVLQVNRLHFHMTDIHERYNAKIVHIIRNPFDVYNSILVDFYRSTYTKDWKWKYYYQYKFRKWYDLHLNHFDIKPMYEFIQKKYGYNQDYFHASSDGTFNYFLVNWIVCNYHAIKSINDVNGILVTYEDVVSNTEKNFLNISNYTGLNMKPEMVKKAKKIRVEDMRSKYDLSNLTKGTILDEMSKYIYENINT